MRKRHYRQRVKCEACSKEIDSDFKDKHVMKMHNGEKVKFSVIVEASQMKLTGFLFGNTKQPRQESQAYEEQQQACQSKEINVSDLSENVFIAETVTLQENDSDSATGSINMEKDTETTTVTLNATEDGMCYSTTTTKQLEQKSTCVDTNKVQHSFI